MMGKKILASLGPQQQELPLPPSLDPSKDKGDNIALASRGARKCQLSISLVSQED